MTPTTQIDVDEPATRDACPECRSLDTYQQMSRSDGSTGVDEVWECKQCGCLFKTELEPTEKYAVDADGPVDALYPDIDEHE
jgi:hypothetical protein